MMLLSTLAFVMALLCAVSGVALMMAMAGAVQSRGETIHWPLIRLYMPRYIHRYRTLTVKESGRPGPLFRPFVILMNAAWVLALLGLALRAL